MSKLFKKLSSHKGESFAEILIAIVIVALGCVVIATLYTSAMSMNLRASQQDDQYYESLSQMEQMFDGTSDVTGKAVITETDSGTKLKVTIQIYGDDSNSAYRRP